MISIIDYGIGNISAFVNLYKRLDIKVNVIDSLSELKTATKLILPGVGHFDYAMEKLNQSGMREELSNLVINKKIPVLGVCVGMQMMCNESEEGHEEGLKWIDATSGNLMSRKSSNTQSCHIWDGITQFL